MFFKRKDLYYFSIDKHKHSFYNVLGGELWKDKYYT